MGEDEGDIDPFARMGKSALDELQRMGGRSEYALLEAWAEGKGIGKFTFRTIIDDLIEEGRLWAPEGYFEAVDEMEPKVPKVVAIQSASTADIAKMKSYLKEYWSVGLLRLFDDMSRAGVKDVNEVVKLLASQGYIEMPNAGVVNATPKLSSGKASKSESNLSELVKL